MITSVKRTSHAISQKHKVFESFYRDVFLDELLKIHDVWTGIFDEMGMHVAKWWKSHIYACAICNKKMVFQVIISKYAMTQEKVYIFQGDFVCSIIRIVKYIVNYNSNLKKETRDLSAINVTYSSGTSIADRANCPFNIRIFCSTTKDLMEPIQKP